MHCCHGMRQPRFSPIGSEAVKCQKLQIDLGQNWVRKSRFVLTRLEILGWTKLSKDHDARLK